MKKLIPIFSILIASLLIQSCDNRNEDLMHEDTLPDITDASTMRGDSTKTSGETVDPDPPVRDGDNWRQDLHKH